MGYKDLFVGLNCGGRFLNLNTNFLVWKRNPIPMGRARFDQAKSYVVGDVRNTGNNFE